MGNKTDFVLVHLTSDRTLIRLREKTSGAEFTFLVNMDGTLGHCEVSQGSPELRSGAPIVMDDHLAVNALIVEARKAAKALLANAP
jgi:hypothetical protein